MAGEPLLVPGGRQGVGVMSVVKMYFPLSFISKFFREESNTLLRDFFKKLIIWKYVFLLSSILQIHKRCRAKDTQNTCNNKMLQTQKRPSDQNDTNPLNTCKRVMLHIESTQWKCQHKGSVHTLARPLGGLTSHPGPIILYRLVCILAVSPFRICILRRALPSSGAEKSRSILSLQLLVLLHPPSSSSSSDLAGSPPPHCHPPLPGHPLRNLALACPQGWMQLWRGGSGRPLS